ncbi:unnamed protein product [Acanthoscelides obtectus]|nr:unnamed protein product [Acanthoscelides obtectus]CAK1623197.1 General transcription factor IIE subunit 1 [Acanthoscelides obtectus]
MSLNPLGQEWSGESTRRSGFAVEETRVDIMIGEESNAAVNRKEQPIWMTESTVVTTDGGADGVKEEGLLDAAASADADGGGGLSSKNDDIMSVLLAHEKRPAGGAGGAVAANAIRGLAGADSDSSNSEPDEMRTAVDAGEVELMESEDEEDDAVPTVAVGGKTYPITDINDTIIAEMTQAEKEIYVQVFQEYYSHMSY